MNSKIVGAFNFLNALLGGAILYVYFSLQPKINEIYQDLGQQQELSFRSQFLIVATIIVISMYLGFTLLFSKTYSKKEQLQTVVIYCVLSFLLLGYFGQQLATIYIESIYTTTNSF